MKSEDGTTESSTKKKNGKSNKIVKTTEDGMFLSPKKASKKANPGQECEFQKSPSKKTKAAKKEAKPEKEKNLKALSHALPINVKECQALFFENDHKINPVFKYENDEMAKSFISNFQDQYDDELLEIAVKILDSFVEEYGNECANLKEEGRVLDQEETKEIILKYLNNLAI